MEFLLFVLTCISNFDFYKLFKHMNWYIYSMSFWFNTGRHYFYLIKCFLNIIMIMTYAWNKLFLFLNEISKILSFIMLERIIWLSYILLGKESFWCMILIRSNTIAFWNWIKSISNWFLFMFTLFPEMCILRFWIYSIIFYIIFSSRSIICTLENSIFYKTTIF